MFKLLFHRSSSFRLVRSTTACFDQLFELVQLCQHRRTLCFLCFFDLFAGVLGKSCCQRIRITTFEKDQVLGWGAAAVLLHRIVHAVFPGDLLKLLDGGIGDLDIGNALVLTNELLDRLLTMGLHRRVPASLLIAASFPCDGQGIYKWRP